MNSDTELVCSFCENRISSRGGLCGCCGEYNAPFKAQEMQGTGSTQKIPAISRDFRSLNVVSRGRSLADNEQKSPLPRAEPHAATFGLEKLNLRRDASPDLPTSHLHGQPQPTGIIPGATSGRGGRGGARLRGGFVGKGRLNLACPDEALQVQVLTDAEKRGLLVSAIQERERAKKGDFRQLPPIALPAPAKPQANKTVKADKPPESVVKPAMSRVLNLPAQASNPSSIGDAKPLLPGDMKAPARLTSTGNLMPADAGRPVLPNPPCSANNPRVWPFDFERLSTHPEGEVRTMVWPCRCQAKLPNGNVCGGSHPTSLHGKETRFIEIWLRKRVDGQKFHCTMCAERNKNGNEFFNHDTEDHGKGMWRVHPGSPIGTLDDHLKKFVALVPHFHPLQPFHIHFYNPAEFEPPPQGSVWPRLPQDLPRLVLGYHYRNDSPAQLRRGFDNWCDCSKRLLGMTVSGPSEVSVDIPELPTTGADTSAGGQAVEPARLGWWVFPPGHANLPPPDYRPDHHLWFNPDFERAMDKCLDTLEREEIATLKNMWSQIYRSIRQDALNEEDRSTMSRYVGRAWDLYNHIYPHWVPGAHWSAPSRLSNWRTNQRVLHHAKRDEGLKALNINLTLDELDDSLDFTPLDPEAVDLRPKAWADRDDDEEEIVWDIFESRAHPQLYPTTSHDARHHIESWHRELETFLSLSDKYGTWIVNCGLEARGQLTLALSMNKSFSKAQSDFLRGAQEQAFTELMNKVETFISDLQAKFDEFGAVSGNPGLTCSRIADDLGALSTQYEESWRQRAGFHVAQGAPKSLWNIYMSFCKLKYDQFRLIAEGLLGAYMPFESRTKTVLPRFKWPKAFIKQCMGQVKEDVEVTSNVQEEDTIEQSTVQQSAVEEVVPETSAVEEIVSEDLADQDPVVKEPVVEEILGEEETVEELNAEEPVKE